MKLISAGLPSRSTHDVTSLSVSGYFSKDSSLASRMSLALFELFAQDGFYDLNVKSTVTEDAYIASGMIYEGL